MADSIIAVILNTLNNYLIDLGVVSKTLSDKAVNKLSSSVRQSVFSSLQDYAEQGSSELDEKLAKLKKQPIIERLNYLYGDKTRQE